MTQTDAYNILKKNKKKWFSNIELEELLNISKISINRNCLILLKKKEIERKIKKIAPNGYVVYLWKWKK